MAEIPDCMACQHEAQKPSPGLADTMVLGMAAMFVATEIDRQLNLCPLHHQLLGTCVAQIQKVAPTKEEHGTFIEKR